MGNKTATRAPVDPYETDDPYGYPYYNNDGSYDPNAPLPDNVYVTTGTVTSPSLYPDELMALTKTPTPPIPHTSPTFTPPIDSNTEHRPPIAPMPASSPTFAFPVVPSTTPVPVVSSKPTTPAVSSTTVTPREILPKITPVEPQTVKVPTKTPSPTILPVLSPKPVTPTGFPTAVTTGDILPKITPVESQTVKVPTKTPSPIILPAPSPIPVIPARSRLPVAPIAFSSPTDPILSSTPNINNSPIISPDTSAMSPTLDLPPTPKGSPIPTAPVTPVKPIHLAIKKPAATHKLHDAATSPMAPITPRIPAVRKTTSSKPVARKQTIPPEPVAPRKSILKAPKPVKPIKHATLSSAERSSKWYQFEKEYQEKQKGLTYITQDFDHSPTSPPETMHIDLKPEPIVPDISPGPSYPLRTTAVCNHYQDSPLLSDRSQSVHKNISIFQFCLTYNETNHSISDHTKATMFKMDTRLRQTPFPIPSLAFLTKNFSDGEHEATAHQLLAPSFGSLGLQHGPETNPVDLSPTRLRIQEKQRQRKLQQSTQPSDDPTDSTNSFQFVTSTVMSQSDFPSIEPTLSQNHHRHVPSILKKPSPHFTTKPSFIAESREIFQESQKKNIQDNPSAISFTLNRSPWPKKASESISRSEKLIHRKKLMV